MPQPVTPPQGPAGPVGVPQVGAAIVSVHQAWHNLCVRLATWSPKVAQDGARYLDKVDRITGLSSRRALP